MRKEGNGDNMETERNGGENLDSSSFRIEGICSCEFKIVEKKLKHLKGVHSYSLNPVTSQLKITYDRSLVSVEGIQKAVSKAGAKATLMKSDQIM